MQREWSGQSVLKSSIKMVNKTDALILTSDNIIVLC